MVGNDSIEIQCVHSTEVSYCVFCTNLFLVIQATFLPRRKKNNFFCQESSNIAKRQQWKILSLIDFEFLCNFCYYYHRKSYQETNSYKPIRVDWFCITLRFGLFIYIELKLRESSQCSFENSNFK